ncbi:MAG: phosphodiesterase [Firmicutes bacterium]|nr:phosphodiesterase [Bacillota bacterium]
MKIMFASDIHGSIKYAEMMKNAYLREGAEGIVLLGDLLYHGPRNDLPEEYAPKKVIALLNGMKNDIILCVRGNCEAEVDAMVLDFPCLADYAVMYLDGKSVFVTHGHLYNPENPPKLKPCDYLMNGHTHIGAYEKRAGFTYLNPGSVSIPKDGRHSYMIYEDGEFSIKELR